MRKLYWLGPAVLLTQAACSTDFKPASDQAGTPQSAVGTRADVRRALSRLQSPAQVFTVRSDQDTVLRGAQGTEIHLVAGSLDVPKGSRVRLALREFYSPADMVWRA